MRKIDKRGAFLAIAMTAVAAGLLGSAPAFAASPAHRPSDQPPGVRTRGSLLGDLLRDLVGDMERDSGLPLQEREQGEQGRKQGQGHVHSPGQGQIQSREQEQGRVQDKEAQ